MRSGQHAARGCDIVQLADALGLEGPILGGFDWGGSASCVAAALWRERIGGLIIRDGNRAGDVISRMRTLFKKVSTTKERFDINEAVEEVVILAQSELQRNRVSLQMQLTRDLPVISGDRIQWQQVLFNLLMNAIEAMSGVEKGPRELLVSSEKVTAVSGEPGKGQPALAAAEWTLVAVRDSGPGLDAKSLDRLFDASILLNLMA